MGRYGVRERVESGELLYELLDEEAALEATVWPALGCQCVGLTANWNGVEVDFLTSPPDLASLRAAPLYFGNPILFPFPNRIRGGRFTYDGRVVKLPCNEEKLGNAAHGLVFTRPWQVVDSGAETSGGAWIRSRFTLHDFPEISKAWPFPFEVDYTYRLFEGKLENVVVARNTGSCPMPLGLGLHPWFRLPLAPRGRRQACRLRAPVHRVWELVDLIPTGRIVPAPLGKDLRGSVEIDDLDFDDVYAGLRDEANTGEWTEASYTDPGAGAEMLVRSDASFRQLVVHAPGGRPVICIEPYTCVTDAFNLESRGVDAGMDVLVPGEEWRAEVHYIPRLLS